jgi:tRNA(Ile)-lysidine synthase
MTTERLLRLGRRAALADQALEAIAHDRLAVATERRTDCLMRLDWRQISTAPAEVRLRALGRGMADITPDRGPPQLERLERLLGEIDAAFGANARIRRTLAGRMVTLMTDGVMTIAPAPPRRTG